MGNSQGSVIENVDVPYGSDEAHHMDFYHGAESSSNSRRAPLLVFIHGGAWRTGSRKDHIKMARSLAAQSGAVVAVIDYRLTLPTADSSASSSNEHVEFTNRHPAHIEDVYAALRFLLLPNNGGKTAAERFGYDPSNAFLMGHSVGAWMAAAVLLDPCRAPRKGSGQVWPRLCQNDGQARDLRRRIKAYLLVDGIYSLPSLLDEYPDYRSFVAQAFPLEEDQYGVEQEQLASASVETWPYAPDGEDAAHSERIKVGIYHSLDDELLSTRQSDEALEYLKRTCPSRAQVFDVRAHWVSRSGF
ncbi:alpha/beta-hydrolase [Jaminaea rosea]|uniref:Alpha/beta-hydrolase n=1 Tax=Jaminaea rosea TaxID=1569628 RepID=A0A316UTK9_9BASI|nr:alpha/beta-hydrolase [Jaminaea rosea]PWN28334.1 alpha/beta-hydrolase [Jaminaea rosea]